MKFRIRALVAAGNQTVATPPTAEFKKLVEFERDYAVGSVEQLPHSQIEDEVMDMVCRPVHLVLNQGWETPYDSPGKTSSDMFYRHCRRYDWSGHSSLWVCVEIE